MSGFLTAPGPPLAPRTWLAFHLRVLMAISPVMCAWMPPRALAAGTRIDRYELIELVGRGAMGEVWRARHSFTDADCAIKVLHADLATQRSLADLFVREARVGARLSEHPNIVQVKDAGLDGITGLPFLAMELLNGETLDEYRLRRGPVPWPLLADLVEQLGSAMTAAHGKRIVHRDLKPSNLFLEITVAGQPVLKVLDFGIARVLEEDAGRTATEAGTPAYGAPEQLGALYREMARERGVDIARHVSPQTDIWALGLVAYDLLTGSEAGAFWQCSTASELPIRIALRAAPIPTEAAGAARSLLPPGFDGWFARCCHRDARQRWKTFSEAAGALGGLLTGHGVCDFERARTSDTVPERATEAQSPGAQDDPSGRCLAPPGPVEGSAANGREAAVVSTTTAPTHSAARRRAPSRPWWIAVGGLVTLVLVAVAGWTLTVSPTGNLSVAVTTEDNARPGRLSILIDGKERCSALPCELTGLAIGSHAVSVVAEGFDATATRMATVRSKASARVVMRLMPKPPTGARVLAEGSGLRVIIDKTDRGAPPVMLQGLTPGRHQLQVVDDKGLHERFEQTFQVHAGEVTELVPRLQIKRGQLTILPGENSEGAVIRIQSEATEQTVRNLPSTLELPPVSHLLTAVRIGYHRFEARIDFPGGGVEQGIVVKLDPVIQSPQKRNESARQTVLAREADAAETSPAITRGPKPISDASEVGILDISSSPTAAAVLDGVPIGHTPKTGLRVPQGWHTVVFIHRKQGRKVAKVLVQPGQTAAAAARFEADEAETTTQPGTLNLESDAAASVFLDGAPIGHTPLAGVRASPGRHTVVFVHPQYGRRLVTVDAVSGKQATATVRFQTEGSSDAASASGTSARFGPGF